MKSFVRGAWKSRAYWDFEYLSWSDLGRAFRMEPNTTPPEAGIVALLAKVSFAH